MKELKVVIAGFGVVGEAFAALLLEKETFLKEKHDLQITVVGIGGSSKGSVLNNNGLPLEEILRAKRDGLSIESVCEGTKGLPTIDVIRKAAADLLVEVTPTNFTDGLPGADHIDLALDRAFHVVTVNKGPVALFYKRLSKKAHEKGVELLIEGTVVSGTPVISLIEKGLKGAEIISVRGILNGTTNYILCEMEEGADYSVALQKAQDLGYAETDPTGDVEGHDAAGKVIILANAIMGGDLIYDEVDCTGISHITSAMVSEAKSEGKRFKLVGEVSFSKETGKVKASVSPEKVEVTSFLGSIGGAENGLVIKTDTLGDVCIQGPGAGGRETAFGILSDILNISI